MDILQSILKLIQEIIRMQNVFNFTNVANDKPDLTDA